MREATQRRGALRTVAYVGSLLCLCLVVTFTLPENRSSTSDATSSPSPAPSTPSSVQRVCSVLCSGPVLRAVQNLASPLFNDSKTFVDMPLLADPEEVLQQFLAARLDKPGADPQVG